MAAFKMTATYYEDGYGDVVDVFLVTDTYDDLYDLDAAVEVNVFQPGESAHELDVAAGTFADDVFPFEMNEATIESVDDADAVALVLTALDPAVFVYVARFINPTTPTAAPEDAEFVGRVKSDMQHQDADWKGAQWSGAIAPLKRWKCTAGSYGIAVLLDAPLRTEADDEETGVMNALVEDDAWIAANVQDRLGYFKSTGLLLIFDGKGQRQVRWASLARLDVLLQKLIDLSVPTGITATFEVTTTAIYAQPARWRRYLNTRTGNIQTRYVQGYEVIHDDRALLKTGGTGPGSMYVSWLLLTPPSAEKDSSWLRYGSVAELLYAIAQSLGLYVEIIPIDGTTVTIRFAHRGALIGTEVYLRDAVQSERDLKTLDVEKEQLFRGDAWYATKEGWHKTYFMEEYGPRTYNAGAAPDRKGVPLALTIAPTARAMSGLGYDAGYTFKAGSGRSAVIPHNAVFWDSTTGRSEWALDDDPQKRVQQNAEAVHTAIYIETVGRADTGLEYGVEGETIVAPVARIEATIYSPGAGQDISRAYTELGVYANDLYGADRAAFEAEYAIDSPYTCSFSLNPDGSAPDWRHMKTAATVTLDGVEYVVRSVSRPFGRPGTSIGLHALSRFAFTPPDPLTVTEEGEDAPSPLRASDNLTATGIVGPGGVTLHSMVAMLDDGTLVHAEAHHAHYGRVVGMALTSGAEGDTIYYQTTGRVEIGVDHGIAAGSLVYLRSPDGVAVAYVNISDDPLTASDSGTNEDMYQPLGMMEAGGILNLDIRPPAVYYPPLT
jgi:hypothetical protein